MSRLVDLAVADIGEVMAIERLPGYEAFIGQWTAEEHAAELTSPAAHHLGWREGDRLEGFVIFQRLLDPIVRLRRIAVARPGGGTGTALFRAAVDWAFGATTAEAVDLHVRPDNHRARHVYAREGFVAGGREDLQGEGMIFTRAAWAAASKRQPPVG